MKDNDKTLVGWLIVIGMLIILFTSGCTEYKKYSINFKYKDNVSFEDKFYGHCVGYVEKIDNAYIDNRNKATMYEEPCYTVFAQCDTGARNT